MSSASAPSRSKRILTKTSRKERATTQISWKMVGSFTFPPLNSVLASLTAGAAGLTLYFYMKKRSDDKKQSVVIVHLEIPKDVAAIVIGREGANVRAIECKSGATISFVDSGGPLRLCVIRGGKENVQVAREMVLETIKEHGQVHTTEVNVSQKFIAYLAAQNNEKLRSISSDCGARIYIDKTKNKPESLLIRGTHDQIEKAKEILKQVALDEELRDKELHESLAARSSRGSMKTYKSPVHADKTGATITHIGRESLVATGSDGYAEVFVSAVRNPHHFYVQLVGSRSIELDRLVEEMTDYYSNDTINKPSLSKVEVGGLVAALFAQDNCWYRGRIVSVDEEKNDQNQGRLLIDFVDFGDQEEVSLENLMKLRPDFLTLRFQAIECRLVDVEPLVGNIWNEDAVDAFESLTYCSQWKPLMARVECHLHSSERLVPCVKLVDTNGEKDIDIGTELVRQGFAVPANAK